MGCRGSKEARAQQYAVTGNDEEAAPDEQAGATANAAANKGVQAAGSSGGVNNQPVASPPKLDPKDFQFIGCKDEVKVKEPGTINGQSFTIDDCQNCDIYILDYCGQVTMDDCKNCRVFIGPTDGSVFVRNSSGCNLAIVCRQLRLRDCAACNVALMCRTRPIVESSSNIGFTCFDMPYPALEGQMRSAKLGMFHNFWWHIYDFTPKAGNWHLLPASATAASLLGPAPADAAALMAPQREAAGSAHAAQPPSVLVTYGDRSPGPEGQYLFLLFDGGRRQQALELAGEAAGKGWLLRANEARLSSEAAAALAAEAGWAKAVAKALASPPGKGSPGGGCVGLELAVPGGEAEALRARAQRAGAHASGGEAAGRAFRYMGLEG